MNLNSVLIITDGKISPEAKEKLTRYGELMELMTEGITYPAISGHPDIFFCQAPGYLIVAPNLPENSFNQLAKHGIGFRVGGLTVGPRYPSSCRYNAVATDTFLIHNFRHTDLMITRTLEDLQSIHVEQGYCRCNLLPLKGGYFITSDEGIYHELERNDLQGLKVHPSGIQLDGFPHGFFGGCCGVFDNTVFLNGNLNHFPEGKKVREFLVELEYEIVELADGPLVDVGSILFIKM